MENTQPSETNKEIKSCMLCKNEGCGCKKWIQPALYVVVGFLLGIFLTGFLSHGKKYEHQKERQEQMMHKMSNGNMMENTASMNHGMNMENMMMSMSANMKGKTGKDLEKSFLSEMVPHHQGAVDMAKMILVDSTISKELRDFAQNIITLQEKEIEQMNDWLKKY